MERGGVCKKIVCVYQARRMKASKYTRLSMGCCRCRMQEHTFVFVFAFIFIFYLYLCLYLYQARCKNALIYRKLSMGWCRCRMQEHTFVFVFAFVVVFVFLFVFLLSVCIYQARCMNAVKYTRLSMAWCRCRMQEHTFLFVFVFVFVFAFSSVFLFVFVSVCIYQARCMNAVKYTRLSMAWCRCRMQLHTFSPAYIAQPSSMCHSNELEPSQQDFLNKQDQGHDNNTVDSFPYQVVWDTISGYVRNLCHKSVQKTDESESGQSWYLSQVSLTTLVQNYIHLCNFPHFSACFLEVYLFKPGQFIMMKIWISFPLYEQKC